MCTGDTDSAKNLESTDVNSPPPTTGGAVRKESGQKEKQKPKKRTTRATGTTPKEVASHSQPRPRSKVQESDDVGSRLDRLENMILQLTQQQIKPKNDSFAGTFRKADKQFFLESEPCKASQMMILRRLRILKTWR